jgi:hypothetical protein
MGRTYVETENIKNRVLRRIFQYMREEVRGG